MVPQFSFSVLVHHSYPPGCRLNLVSPGFFFTPSIQLIMSPLSCHSVVYLLRLVMLCIGHTVSFVITTMVWCNVQTKSRSLWGWKGLASTTLGMEGPGPGVEGGGWRLPKLERGGLAGGGGIPRPSVALPRVAPRPPVHHAVPRGSGQGAGRRAVDEGHEREPEETECGLIW